MPFIPDKPSPGFIADSKAKPTPGFTPDDITSGFIEDKPSIIGKLKAGTKTYLKEAQPAFKSFARHPFETITGRTTTPKEPKEDPTTGEFYIDPDKTEISPQEFERIAGSTWAELLQETYPGSQRNTAGVLLTQFGGSLLELGTKPSTFIAAGALERALPFFAQKALNIHPIRKLVARHIPTFARKALTDTALVQKKPLEQIAQKQLHEARILSKTEPITDPLTELVSKIRKPKGPELSKINLDKYPSDTKAALENIITKNPEFIKRKVISHGELKSMADNLDNTVITKKLLSLPEGQLAAEALKLRQGEEGVIRSLLASDMDELATSIKDVLVQRQTSAVGRLSTELGRALEQQKINIEPQRRIADMINAKIKAIRNDPMLARRDSNVIVDGLVQLRKKVLTKDFNPTWFDKGYEFWLNNILSGPMTHTVNITSNTLFAAVKPLEKAVYSTIDIPASWITGKRTHYFSEIPAQLKGLYKFAKGEKLSTGVATGSKLDFIREPLIKGAKGKVIRLPTKALVWEDDFSKKLVGWMETLGRAETIAKQEGLKGLKLIQRKNELLVNPTEELISQVNKEQLIKTFQDMTALGDIVTKLPQKFLRWILPFRRTLSSIITKGLERTPLGFVKVGVKGAKALTGASYPQVEIVSDIGNAIIGTGLMAGITKAYIAENVIGAAPKDKAKRDLFYAQGKQPYSIKIKDNYMPINRLEPYGTATMQMIDLIQGYVDSDKDLPVDKITDSVMNLTKSLGNKTFLSGITNFVNAITNPEVYGERFLGQALGGFVPFSGLIRNIQRTRDLTVREAKTPIERLLSQVSPHHVPPRISSLGEEIKRKPIGISKFTPFPVTKEEKDTVVDELVRLDKAIGYPSKTIRSVFKTEKPLKISREDYRRLLAGTGKTIVNQLRLIFNTSHYQNQPDEIKIRFIENVISNIRTIGREELKIEKGFR